MTTTDPRVDNGVNVEALLGARDAFADTPEIAQFQWRSTVTWVNGTHSRSTVDGFHGFGDEQRHHTTFSYDVDHPLQFAAQDNGVTPTEFVLVAPRGAVAEALRGLRHPHQPDQRHRRRHVIRTHRSVAAGRRGRSAS